MDPNTAFEQRVADGDIVLDRLDCLRAALRAHASDVMPKVMQPAHVRCVESLPVTATNEIEKYKLKQRLAAELAGAGR